MNFRSKTQANAGLISLCFLLLFSSQASRAANRYWIGLLGGNWNNILNWSNTSGGLPGLSVPGISDVAIFDASAWGSCIITANTSVGGIVITSAYTGTVSTGSGITLSAAASGFSQAGGTFAGSNGNISVSGPFSLGGGTFIATSGTMQLSGGYTFSGGAFNHNNGTLALAGTQTLTGSTALYDLLFIANGGVTTIAAGTMLSAANTVTINGNASCTINTGTVEIKGNLYLVNSSNNTVNGGSATFLFNGTGNQAISSAITTLSVGANERMCVLPSVEINKASGSLSLSGVIGFGGTSWKTTAGTLLVNAGTSTLNIISGATFSGQNLQLNAVHIWANGQVITLSPATYTLTTNHLSINGGSYYQVNTGVIEIRGDLNLISTGISSINGGTGTFLFDGTGTQNISSSANNLNNVCGLPSIAINKTSGPLNFSGIINFSGSSWNTIAGASLVNAGTSTVNILKSPTLSGQDLSLYDLLITGNFSTIGMSSSLVWTSTHLLTFAGGSNWYQVNTGTLNAKGDVLVTNTNSSNNIGGNATLLFDGTANQTLTGAGTAGAGRLPQVQINKTGGTLTLSGIISADNNWTYISGNVDASTSTVDFYKNAVIDGQGSSSTMAFYNVIFSGFISLGGNLDVNGDFTVRSGVNNRLDVSTANYQVNVAGNWINNNSATALSFNQQSGKVVFDGGSAQVLSLASGTDTETFYNLEINNAGAGLSLGAPAAVSGSLSFIAGNIISTSSNSLLLGSGATASGAGSGGFVSGPLYKTGMQAFTFPVGKSGSYAPIAMSAPTVSSLFAAEYFPADPNSVYSTASRDSSLTNISGCEYWAMNRLSGSSQVSVSLTWDARSCGIGSMGSLRVASWNGTQWKDQGSGSLNGTAGAGTITSAGAATVFAAFSLSSSSVSAAALLPVELYSFTGDCRQDAVSLNWRTATEHNNRYFSVERSSAGGEWATLATVKGRGTSRTDTAYSFSDPGEATALSYYRLKQTDLDGQYRYSGVIAVEPCSGQEPGFSVSAYPNPSAGTFSFMVRGSERIAGIEIANMAGEKIYAGDYSASISLSGRPAGLYLVTFSLGSGARLSRLVQLL